MGVFDGVGGCVRAQRCERSEVEVGALPEEGDDGPQHRELFVGGTAVDVDRAEQRARDRFDELGGDEEGHREKLSSTGIWDLTPNRVVEEELHVTIRWSRGRRR